MNTFDSGKGVTRNIFCYRAGTCFLNSFSNNKDDIQIAVYLNTVSYFCFDSKYRD